MPQITLTAEIQPEQMGQRLDQTSQSCSLNILVHV